MVNLGAIERVGLREAWPNEAQDFTPWLAENLDKLGEALGLDLELQSVTGLTKTRETRTITPQQMTGA